LLEVDEETVVRGAITILMVSTVIVTLGTAALIFYASRRKAREKSVLWFGLFSVLYGVVLVVRNPAFRQGFGQPDAIELSIERLTSWLTIVPGLLLFEEFYGRGWRSSLRWLTWSYCVLATAAISGLVTQSLLDLVSPGTMLVIMVPLVLALGYFAEYKPPPQPNSRVLFAGLLLFFCAYSVDRLLHTQVGNWHLGVEPYGFLCLVICLLYATSQRVITDERRLDLLTDVMRAAATIQKAILPATVPSLENIQIAVRYAPMTAVAGDLYGFPAVRPNCIGVLMADVIGHGVAAALVASMIKVAISTQHGLDGEPANVISGLNAILCNEDGGQYATAVYLYMDAVNKLGRYSAAAHPASLLWRRSKQTIETLGDAGLLLGVRSGEAYAESEFSFDKGDRILVYTDGLTEAENAAGQSFGEAALPTFIRENQDLDVEQFVDLLLREVLVWSRDGIRRQQEDDITMLVIDT
jgi:sigma-B regulation protein RsbU (phosphoserine phosphatase)